VSRGRLAGLFALGIVLQIAAFPPFSLWPLAFAMLAPLAAVALVATPRAAFAFAWAQQTAAGLAVAHWVVYALAVEYEAPLVPGLAFFALLGGAYALVPATAVAVFARTRDRVANAALALHFGVLFVLAEWLRAEPLALPWVLAVQPLTRAPLLIQGADLGGAYLPGLGAAAIGAGIAAWAVRRTLLPLAGAAALVAGLLGYGAVRLAAAPDPGPTLAVGIVQAAVPQRLKYQPGSALRNSLHHVELTQKLAAGGPVDLVMWSETSIEEDLDAHPELVALLRQASAQVRAPIVTGASRSAGGGLANVVVAIDPSGVRATYAKQMLVPFAESDPEWLGFLAPLLGPVSAGVPYRAGREDTIFPGALPFAAPICFEITDPSLMRRFRRAGASLVLNLSNDAWFGETGYPELHLAHAVVRAVELRTWIARATNTGVSAVIDPAGRVVTQLGVGEAGSLRARVGAAWPATPYARAGSLPFVLLLACAAIGSPLRPRRRPEARSTSGRKGSGPGRRGGRSRA
jgi:apolipoprotein N-acyltransferase